MANFIERRIITVFQHIKSEKVDWLKSYEILVICVTISNFTYVGYTSQYGRLERMLICEKQKQNQFQLYLYIFQSNKAYQCI